MKREEIIKDIQQNSFNTFFTTLKQYVKQRNKKESLSYEVNRDFNGLNKRDIIIFNPNVKRLSKIELKKGKLVFPFDKVFLEYPIADLTKDYVLIAVGFLFSRKKSTKNIILCSIVYNIYKNNEKDLELILTKVGHVAFKEEDITNISVEMSLANPNSSEDGYNPTTYFFNEIIQVIKKFIVAIDRKEYTFYKKWTPKGIIHKEIVFSHTRASHKRHFWKDSGKFLIPSLSKEEIIEKGYKIDEIVYREGELRKDVPYKEINQVEVGIEKPKIKENRRINLLRGRVLRQEEKLGRVLNEIYQEETIRRHDRKKLKGLELDFYIPKLKLAFEYDGEQHFDRELCEKVFKSDFDELKERDKLKDKLCRRKKIRLIRIKFDESLTKTRIKELINQ